MLVLLWTALFGCEPDPNAPQCLEAERIQVFFDADKDGFGIPGTQRSICPTETGAPEGFSTNDDDCNDAVAAINPGALEECDGRDNDCDDQSDEGLRVVLFYLDSDADGFGSPDLSLTIESCAPPVGYVENRQDCDDSDAGINPQALEICDNRDNDCNLLIDDDDPFRDVASAPRWFPDVDRDGYGTDDDSLVTIQCVPPNNIATQIQGDCNDERADISPDAQETCNRIDDDCDNLIDDSDPDIPVEELVRYWADDDLDGFGDPAVSTLTCFQPWFFVDNDLDCDDDEPLLTDESSGLWWFDNDNDRFGAGMIEGPSCTSPGPGYELVAKGEDCNDAEPFDNPDATERCDPGTPADNDCDGLVDTQDDSLDLSTTTEFWEDDDEDGFGNPLVSTQACTRPLGFTDNFDDCNDADKEIFPDANEVCDTIDNDCDDLIDDADGDVDLTGAPIFFADFDEDGYGDINSPFQACVPPTGFVDNDVDCDDTDETQLVDGTWKLDLDGDGVGAGAESAEVQCTPPFTDAVPTFNGDDCDPTNPDRFPGNEEICNNGIDEDCDGADLTNCIP